MTSTSKSNHTWWIWLTSILGALVCLAPLLAYTIWFNEYPLSNEPSNWSSYAGFVSGTTGTLITLVALIFVARTYKSQVRNFYRTGFETTLFKMIEFHHKLIDGLRIDGHGQPAEGRFALHYSCSEIVSRIGRGYLQNLNYHEIRPEKMKEEIETIYSTLYDERLHSSGHYFRHLYHIFKYIHNSELDSQGKEEYAKMVRAQLSGQELVLIGINGLTLYGKKFKELIEEYGLLHRLMNDDIFRAAFVKIYAPAAFGNEPIDCSLPFNQDISTKLYSKNNEFKSQKPPSNAR